MHVQIDGTPLSGGGVAMTASSVSIGTSRAPSLFGGSVTSLNGTEIGAHVTSGDGHTLLLSVALQIAASGGGASGTLNVNPVQ
jgi:hypothetical protein